MSRSGYSDDFEYDWKLIMWRGAVTRAINGKRGQAFLREMLVALDAMPVKELITDELIDADGAVCAIGAVGVARGMDMGGIDVGDPIDVAASFNIAHALAAEIEFINDEDFCFRSETSDARFQRVRAWVVKNIRPDATPTP